MGYGVDISHHQNHLHLPWDEFKKHCDFIICRSGYGARLRDRRVDEHFARARDTGCAVGLYHFFRPHHDPEEQFALLHSVARDVGLRAGDIVPTIDIEHDPIPKPGKHVDPSWEPKAFEFVSMVEEEYGKCMVYITQREWGMLGKPSWVLTGPLWVAHYTGRDKPASPNSVYPTIWQHRVADFVPDGKGGYDAEATLPLDQNRLLQALPLIDPEADGFLSEEDIQRVRGQIALSLDETARNLTIDRTS